MNGNEVKIDEVRQPKLLHLSSVGQKPLFQQYAVLPDSPVGSMRRPRAQAAVEPTPRALDNLEAFLYWAFSIP